MLLTSTNENIELVIIDQSQTWIQSAPTSLLYQLSVYWDITKSNSEEINQLLPCNFETALKFLCVTQYCRLKLCSIDQYCFTLVLWYWNGIYGWPLIGVTKTYSKHIYCITLRLITVNIYLKSFISPITLSSSAEKTGRSIVG